MSYSFKICMYCFMSLRIWNSLFSFFRLSFYFNLIWSKSLFWLLILWQCFFLWQCFLMIDVFMCIGTLTFIFILNRKACFVIYNFLSKDFALGQHTPRLSSLKSGCTLTIRNFSPVLISYCQYSLKVLVVHSDKCLSCSQVYGTALIQTVGL